MAATFQNIRVSIFGDKGEIKEQVAMVFDIEIQTQPVTCIRLTSGMYHLVNMVIFGHFGAICSFYVLFLAIMQEPMQLLSV
jgi:hypothetical protein